MRVDLLEIDEALTPSKETVQGMRFPPMCMIDKLINAFHTPLLFLEGRRLRGRSEEEEKREERCCEKVLRLLFLDYYWKQLSLWKGRAAMWSNKNNIIGSNVSACIVTLNWFKLTEGSNKCLVPLKKRFYVFSSWGEGWYLLNFKVVSFCRVQNVSLYLAGGEIERLLFTSLWKLSLNNNQKSRVYRRVLRKLLAITSKL